GPPRAEAGARRAEGRAGEAGRRQEWVVPHDDGKGFLRFLPSQAEVKAFDLRRRRPPAQRPRPGELLQREVIEVVGPPAAALREALDRAATSVPAFAPARPTVVSAPG